jgi:hypothetical protein
VERAGKKCPFCDVKTVRELNLVRPDKITEVDSAVHKGVLQLYPTLNNLGIQVEMAIRPFAHVRVGKDA